MNLHMANKSWNDYIFQIHRDKLEWVNPRSHIAVKNSFYVSSGIHFKTIIRLHIGLVVQN